MERITIIRKIIHQLQQLLEVNLSFRNINLLQYVNPGNPSPRTDVTSGYRQWLQLGLERERQREAERSNLAQESHQTRVSDDINSRFAVQQGQQRSDRQYEVDATRFNQQKVLLQKARTAAAEGRWNEVESMMGTLKSLGANVNRELGPDGKPSYRLEEGTAPGVTGDTYESVQQKIHQGRGFVPYERIQVNRFDNSLGTAKELTRPDVLPNPSTDPQEATSQQQPIGTTQQEQSSTQEYDPYALNTSELQKMNELRLNPLFSGLKGAFPYRYQDNAESLFRGVGAIGASPEGTLEMLQKPLDTASRTWNAEMSSEGQMARAGISQSGRQDSQDRMLVNDGERAAERVSKQYGVDQAVSNTIEMQQIAEQLLSDNPNANADGVKALLSMREGNRLTDKDFNIGVTGLASNFEQLKATVEHVYVNGLTADQKSNFRELVRMFQDGNKRRIAGGSKQMLNYISKLRTEPERYGAFRSITGRIPPEFLPQEFLEYDPSTGNFGGQRAPSSSSYRNSVNIAVPASPSTETESDDLSEFE